MKLLALDSTETACSAALWLDGEVHQQLRNEPRRHGELLQPMVEALLAGAGLSLSALDGIAFSRGPGAFTGVRIATGMAHGLALGADLPLIPLSSLLALAEGARRRTGGRCFLPALDARMGELYWGPVLAEGAALTQPLGEQVAPPRRLEAPSGCEGDWIAIGSGWEAWLEALAPRFRPRQVLHGHCVEAQDLAALGARWLARAPGLPPEQALPVYLRDRVATPPGGG